MKEKVRKLYDLIRKDYIEAKKYFLENCLENHYERFLRAKISHKDTRIKLLDEYIVIYPEYVTPSGRKYHGLFIIGIDDSTGKFFCHRLPWNKEFESENFLDKLTKQKLLRFLGIDNNSIRVQGDIVLRFLKRFNDLKDLIYTIVFNIINCLKNDSNVLFLESMIREFDDNFYNAFLKFLNEKLFNIVSKWLRENEVIYEVTIGNHRITFAGISLNNRINLYKSFSIHLSSIFDVRNINRTFLIIRRHEMEFYHREHGIKKFKIDNPSIIEFRTLNAHRTIVNNNLDGMPYI